MDLKTKRIKKTHFRFILSGKKVSTLTWFRSKNDHKLWEFPLMEFLLNFISAKFQIFPSRIRCKKHYNFLLVRVNNAESN